MREYPFDRELRQHSKSLYFRALRRDPRLVGPFLAVAMMVGSNTTPSGRSRGLYLRRVAGSVGVSVETAHQVVMMLAETGYIEIQDNDPTHGYRLTAVVPTLEIETGRRTWPGPSSQWVRGRSKAWRDFEQQATESNVDESTVDAEAA